MGDSSDRWGRGINTKLKNNTKFKKGNTKLNDTKVEKKYSLVIKEIFACATIAHTNL